MLIVVFFRYVLSEVTEKDKEKISVRIINSLIDYADYNIA